MNESGSATPFVIRHVVADDLERWLPLWDGYNEFYGRVGETALPQEVSEASWSRFLDPDQPMFALVAELEEQLVGLAHYLFHRSTTALSDICYLQDLFTSNRARGKGVASALISRVYDEAKTRGASRVYWQTQESNTQARRLYDKLAERSGFIVYRHSL